MRELLSTMRNPQEVAWGLDQTLEAPGIGESTCFEIRFGSFAPGWRAQLNPLGDNQVSLWTFIRGVARGELERYAQCARRQFLGAQEVTLLEERQGPDPAFVVPHRLVDDGVMACGAAAAQGGLEYGARAGRLAGEVAAYAVHAGDVSRRALRPYERAWRCETWVEDRTLRWGMETLRRLSDAELDELFRRLSRVEFCEDDLFALFGGDPRGALRRVGLERSTKDRYSACEGMARHYETRPISLGRAGSMRNAYYFRCTVFT